MGGDRDNVSEVARSAVRERTLSPTYLDLVEMIHDASRAIYPLEFFEMFVPLPQLDPQTPTGGVDQGDQIKQSSGLRLSGAAQLMIRRPQSANAPSRTSTRKGDEEGARMAMPSRVERSK